MKYPLLNIFFTISFIFILAVSCQSSEKTDVNFELLNREIHALYIDSIDYKRKYADEKERLMALNILKYRITNNSDKKLLFIIDSEKINEDADFCFKITDSIHLTKIPSNPLVNFTDDAVPYLNFMNYQDSVKKADYLKLGIKEKYIEKYRKFMNHSFVLNPKESKTLQSFVKLPIIEELNISTASAPVYFKNICEGDRLFLTYHLRFSDYKDVLKRWQIEELEKNGIIFFEGTIISNSVPIKIIEE